MEGKEKTGRGFRLSLFWTIYFSVTAVTLLLVFIALRIVSARLAEYEAAQPKYVAQEVYARYFQPVNYPDLLADARYDAGEADMAEIMDYLAEEIGDSELSYSIGSSNNPNEVRYIVKAGGKQFASINLKVSETETEHGFQQYEFSYVELYLNTEAPVDPKDPIVFTVTIDVPSAYSVAVDGELLTEEFLTSSYIKTDLMNYYPPDITGVEYAVYTLADLGEFPGEVVVTDSDGQNAEVSFDENTCTYTSGITYSQSLAEEYSEFVTKAMQGYAEYVQASKKVGLNSIKPYFDTESDLYADVVAAGGNRWMVREWSGVDYENVNIGEFYAHTPEIFSCHISFTQLLHRENQEDFLDVVDMYVFLHLTDEGYKIFDWYNV